ncbi:MAG: hypothetical protein H0T46_30245 [Deltaproteobacteria bacterium]|nr:hypothetical protein [Deltaproteobacteria bacterium]
MKRALIVVGIVLAGLGALGIRVVVEGRRALAAGDDAAREGRMTDAIAGWEAAARWYLPFAPHVDDAYERLIYLAGSEHAFALAAWRAVRSAALATRTLWTPHADDLMTANAQIAELASRDPEGALAAGPDAAARKAWHTERLARDPGPSRGGVFLAVLGIGAWLAGIGMVIRGPAKLGAAVTVLGLIGWMIGLAIA